MGLGQFVLFRLVSWRKQDIDEEEFTSRRGEDSVDEQRSCLMDVGLFSPVHQADVHLLPNDYRGSVRTFSHKSQGNS